MAGREDRNVEIAERRATVLAQSKDARIQAERKELTGVLLTKYGHGAGRIDFEIFCKKWLLLEELRILACRATGYRQKEIAGKLKISQPALSNRLKKIKQLVIKFL